MDFWSAIGVKAIQVIFRRFFRNKPTTILEDSQRIHQICRRVVDSGLSIDCLFIIKIHNGKSYLRPHDFIYRSIVGGYHNEFTLKNFKWENHKDLIIDFEYEQLILNVKNYKAYDIKSEDLRPGSPLRISAEFEKLKFKRYFFIRETRSAMWMAMAGTTDRDETIKSTGQHQILNVAVNEIKNIVNKY